jgi:hypothetical protein
MINSLEHVMKAFVLTLTLVLGTMSQSEAAESLKIEVECSVTGTRVTGEKSTREFPERLKVEKRQMPNKNKDGKEENWSVTQSELVSEGTKYQTDTVDITPDHAVISISRVVGAGYNRKLLVFLFIVDSKALELDRVVTSVPSGSDERTRSKCKKL